MPTPTRQLLSRTIYATDGSTSVWDFSFAGGYLDVSHIKAYTVDALGTRVAVVITPAMVIGPNTVRIFPALASGLTLTIYRDTPKDLPIVDFSGGTGFSETALDTNAKQAVFVAAESSDAIGEGVLEGFYTAVQTAVGASASAVAAAATAAGLAGALGSIVVNTFTGNGAQTVFTLTAAPATNKSLTVNFDGITQQHSTYTVVGTTLTFTTAPPNGTVIEVVIGRLIDGAVPGPQGPTGNAGRGITSIVRTTGTGAPGTTDIFTITYSDASTSTFNVYNGANGTNGTNGSTGATGAAGRGITTIVRTSGTGAPGTTDTYTITYTDASTSLFTVHNGADGAGSGTVTTVAALTIGTTGSDVNSSVANPTTTPVITINIPTASGTNRGVLSSADWTAFNAKVSYTPATPGAIGGTTPAAGTFTTLTANTKLTATRIEPRVGSTTSSATPTINTDNVDIYKLTAQAVDITSMTTNLSGTPFDNQPLIIEITGTAARAITWGASFESSTATLPTTTVTTAMLAVAFLWNSATSKWRCVGVA